MLEARVRIDYDQDCDAYIHSRHMIVSWRSTAMLPAYIMDSFGLPVTSYSRHLARAVSAVLKSAQYRLRGREVAMTKYSFPRDSLRE